ncbi:protein SGT1 homolog isoform X2 [Schistocerca cancellata]|nr:protein SGT1 homolog isoform X2 [Schistocerca cancellata]XP_049767001.1 protein SGT1 homolog isoform X2 [Schistocerca cancellata]
MAEGANDAIASAENDILKQTTKFTHDWYQTETHVVVAILFKNTKFESKSVKVEYGERMLSVTAKLENGADYNMELDLAHSIVPTQSTHKTFTTKIEIKMKKAADIRWSVLQGQPQYPEAAVAPIPAAILSAGPPKYPSSAPKSKDWDQVAKELDDNEKPEGEAALNALFQKIYEQGSDEVRRAMNKSFQESGGTVLSTNWGEVAKEKVEVRAPDGLEWRKWDS